MKSIYCILVALAAALPAFGQGTVQFQNYDPAHGINAPVLDAYLRPADGSDTMFRAMLLAGPVSAQEPFPGASKGNLTQLQSSTGELWAPLLTGSMAGYVNVGTDPARVIPGVNWGEQAKIAFIGYYGPHSTWDEVWNAEQFGNGTWDYSLVTIRLPDSPANAADSVLRGLSPTVAAYIPEPSVGLLLALGAFATFAARRTRK